MINHSDKKAGVMAIISGFKPKAERAGQTIEKPGETPEPEESSDSLSLKAAMKQFIKCIKADDVSGAIEAFKMVDEMSSSSEEEDPEEAE